MPTPHQRQSDPRNHSSAEWLISSPGEGWLRHAELWIDEVGLDPLRLVERLRRQDCPHPAEVVEQCTLRRRAKSKFSQAERMFFLAERLEQATSEVLARYKASRLPDELASAADFCCGIGGDALAWAERVGQLTLVDRDAAALTFAQANVRACVAGSDPAARCVDVQSVDVEAFAAWHIDPDRRASGKRTTSLEASEPDEAWLRAAVERNPNGVLKLAPATELDPYWSERAELEWISHRGECRQQVVWCGPLGQATGSRTATTLDTPTGSPSRLTAAPDSVWPIAESLGPYLCEPDPAVLAADLAGPLATRDSLSALGIGVAYFTGPERPTDPLWTAFEIVEALPFDRKRVKAYLQAEGIGHVEVKKRGVAIDPLPLQKAWRSNGPGRATLVLAPIGGRTMCLVCQRL